MKGQEEAQTRQPSSLPILGRSEQGDVSGDSSVTHMAWPCPVCLKGSLKQLCPVQRPQDLFWAALSFTLFP